MQAVQNIVAARVPDMPEPGAPTQLVDQLVLNGKLVLRADGGSDLAQGDEAVSDPGRKTGDRAFEMVPRARVCARAYSRQPIVERRRCRLKIEPHDRGYRRLRQASEQYFTASQVRAQRLRQTIGRPQAAHGFCGRLALLPRND